MKRTFVLGAASQVQQDRWVSALTRAAAVDNSADSSLLSLDDESAKASAESRTITNALQLGYDCSVVQEGILAKRGRWNPAFKER